MERSLTVHALYNISVITITKETDICLSCLCSSRQHYGKSHCTSIVSREIWLKVLDFCFQNHTIQNGGKSVLHANTGDNWEDTLQIQPKPSPYIQLELLNQV